MPYTKNRAFSGSNNPCNLLLKGVFAPENALNFSTMKSHKIDCISKTTQWIQSLKYNKTEVTLALLKEIFILLKKCDSQFQIKQVNHITQIASKKGIEISSLLDSLNIKRHLNSASEDDLNSLALLNLTCYDLDDRFASDPSDYSIAVALALKMKTLGQFDRAKQLLQRVASSGYPERNFARLTLRAINYTR